MRYETFKKLRIATNTVILSLMVISAAPFIGLLCAEDGEPGKLLILAVTAFAGLVLAAGLGRLYSAVNDYMHEAEEEYWQRKMDRRAGEQERSKI